METITLKDGTRVDVADFEFGFTLDRKADVSETDDTIIIEGYASDFEVDRQDEAFEPGAFQKALDDYMQNPVLLYHHKKDTALGAINEARLDKKGLWVRAQVPKPDEGTTLSNYYNQIKAGVLRGFSVGGRFMRRMTPDGPKIFKADLREISVTPLPVNPRTLFAVAGKAFVDDEPTETQDPDLKGLVEKLDAIDAMFTSAEEALEGKASQHPDGPKIAALQYHLQNIHTLATDMKQDSESDEVKSLANDVAQTAKKHLQKVHRVAAKHGPLPNLYGSTVL